MDIVNVTSMNEDQQKTVDALKTTLETTMGVDALTIGSYKDIGASITILICCVNYNFQYFIGPDGNITKLEVEYLD